MKTMITNEIFRKYPSFYRGVVIGKGVNNSASNEIILELLRQSERDVRSDINLKYFKKYPFIQTWRNAHKEFGSNPKDHSPSIESLINRVRGGKDIPYINTLVALFNYISLKYKIPCGGDDMNSIFGNPCLKLSEGNEKFTPFNDPDAIENPKIGEVIYADDAKVMCRKWNWRQGDQTKISLDTKRILINVDGLAPVTKETINDATMELAKLLKDHCGGDVSYNYISIDNPVIEI